MSNFGIVNVTYSGTDWMWQAPAATGLLYLNPAIYTNSFDTIKFPGVINNLGFTVGVQAYYIGYDKTDNISSDLLSNIGWGVEGAPTVNGPTITIKPFLRIANSNGRVINFKSALLKLCIVAQYD